MGHTGGGQLVAGEECTYVWPTKLENPCTSPFYVNSGLTCSAVGNTCGGWTYLACTKSGATCTGPSRTGGGQLIAGEQCSYVWPSATPAPFNADSKPCTSPFYVNSGLTCGMVKNTCGGWTNLDCTKSGATCTGPQHTGGDQLVAGEECTYVWPTKLENPCTSPFYV